MSKKTFSNPCVRCGTERIVTKTWKEKIDNSVIINTESSCPNKECQKKVDQENKRQRDKNTAMRIRNEERIRNRKTARRTVKK